MIRYFYDCEFLERQGSIDLISIGIVSSDDREYYAVVEEVGDEEGDLYKRVVRERWLMENVVSQLPLKVDEKGKPRIVLPTNVYPQNPRFSLDLDDPAVLPLHIIAKQVKAFLLRPNEPMELWAYYGAYDHVVVSWLWGPMVNRPKGIPMFSFDVMQLAASLGMDDANLPQQTGQVHNALDDARWTRDAWRYLTGAARRSAHCDCDDDGLHGRDEDEQAELAAMAQTEADHA